MRAHAPGSRSPRVREPMTKSCLPSAIGAIIEGISSGAVAAVAVEENDDVAFGLRAVGAGGQARP